MKFVYNFSTLVTLFTKIAWTVASDENFDNVELAHIANKLNPIECLRLLEAMYLKRPLTDEEYLQAEVKLSLEDESILRRQLDMPFFNRNNCRNKLQEWSRNLPHRSNNWARTTLEAQLRILGRPDLAKYVRRNRRVVRYFNELSKISRNNPIHLTTSPQFFSKNNHVLLSNGIMENPAKEIKSYSNLKEAQPAHENLSTRESTGAQVASNKSASEDTTTKWTAFLTLLGVIFLTILSTVFFAIYKKNRGALCTKTEKCTEDGCALADRYPRKSFNREIDLEHGDTSPNSYCGQKKDRRSFIHEPSCSPSSLCVREEIPSVRKSKTKKCVKIKPEREQATEKIGKLGCSKKCTGLKDRVVKIDKSTKTKEPKLSEKIVQVENLAKPRAELKKFHERIANILRKDNPTCKCCKCSVFSSDEKANGIKLTNAKNKKICNDEKCQKRKLRNIAELCLSLDETSPSDERNAFGVQKKEKKKKKKKKRKKKIKKEEKDGNKDAEKEKESEKTTPGNSARSKDRRESRIKKKFGKAKKEKYNVEEACTRKTCGLGKISMEETLYCG